MTVGPPPLGRGSGADESDRAISDLVGFVLAFAVIVTAVALVSTFGFGALEDARENELAKNTERSFVLLGRNLNELETGVAEKRTSEIELRSGDLALVGGTNLTFHIERGPGGGPDFDTSIATRRLQYRISGEYIGYETGATFRGAIGSNNSVMQVEPGFVCDEGSHAVVSVVRLTGDTESFIGGGVARISATQRNSSLVYPQNRTATNGNVASNGTWLNVTVNSTFTGGWETYFTREADGNDWTQPRPATDPNTFACEVGDDGVVYIRRAVVEVEFDQ